MYMPYIYAIYMVMVYRCLYWVHCRRAQRYGPIYARRKLICQILVGVIMALVLALGLAVGLGVTRNSGSSNNTPLAVSADVCVSRSIPGLPALPLPFEYTMHGVTP